VRIWPIYKKELRLYFTSPVAYVLLTIFLFIAGYFFYNIFGFFTRASMQTAMNPGMGRDLNVTDSVLRPLFSNMSVILLLLLPLVTMRLFAEERRAGTIELLLTYPVRDGAVLVSKYLAALTLYGVMVAGTLAYPAILLYFTRVEWGPLATAYLGLMMMGAMLLGIGIFASSLTENQIVAALIAFGISLMFWIVSWSAEFAGGPLGTVLTHLSILEHNDTFSKGILDTKDVIYFVDFTALFLFLTLRSLEARRWAG
jgi:ABC-2 type transport system permease protein